MNTTTTHTSSNESLYGDKIEMLISYALQDGVLTDKEKQVLLKKAQAEGIDPDELEMVLDARIDKLKQQRATQSEEKLKASDARSNRASGTRRCPMCGCTVPAFTEICPECKHHFAGFETTTAAKELEAQIHKVYEEAEARKSQLMAERTRIQRQIESAREAIRQRYANQMDAIDSERENGQDESLFGSLLGDMVDELKGAWQSKKMNYRMDTEIKKLSAPLHEIDRRIKEIDLSTERRVDAIVTAFPIPTTKADLFEFLTCMKERGYNHKYREALNKAESLFATEPLFAKFIQERKDAVAAIDKQLEDLKLTLQKRQKQEEQVEPKRKCLNIITAIAGLLLVIADILIFTLICDWAWWGTLLINIIIVPIVFFVCYLLTLTIDDNSDNEKRAIQEKIRKVETQIKQTISKRNELI